MHPFLTKHTWIIENTATILFFALWRSGLPLDQAAWVAAIAASCVLGSLRWSRQAPDTILLGINLHFALTAPVIQIIYSIGATGLAGTLITYAGFAVPVFILLTGIWLRTRTHSGPLGRNALGTASQKRRSVLLLLWTALACVWSYSFLGNQILSVGLPVLSIFLMRRVLSGNLAISRLLPVMILCVLQPNEIPRRTLVAARSIGV